MLREILLFLIPIGTLIIAYILYSNPNNKSLYLGKDGWIVDIFAIIGGSYLMITHWNSDIIAYGIGSIFGSMHLSKAIVKLRRRG